MANETFTATQTTVLTNDVDNDGQIDPGGPGVGDTVTTTVIITNNSTNTAATGVTFTETLNGMTLVNQAGNDINVSPIAFNDAYTAVGNTLLEVGNATSQTGPQSNVAGSVIANDVEFFGDTFVISAVGATNVTGNTTTITTALGGTVTMVTDNSSADRGSFTYISQAGDTGTDTFTYTVRDKGLDGIAGNADDLVSVGTVSITLTNKVWYIDNTAGPGGDGTSTNPFDSLADVSGASGPDGVGDFIYVNTGSGDYTGGITLLNNQTLHGEGAAFTVAGFNLAAAGADPTIANAAGSGVTLASGNTLTGFTVGNTTGFDITNTAATSAGSLTVSDVTLNGSGGLINIDSGGTLNVQLNSATTSAAATRGINLVNVDNSTFTVTGVTTINDATTDGIAVSNSQNSTFTFTGKTTILNDGGANGDGVDLQNNNAVDSTFNFNGGVDITVNGTDAFGFRAQSSGTVNILNPNSDNQITSNNGTAIFINPTAFNASLTSVTAGDGGTGDGIHLEGVSGTGMIIGTVNINGMAGDGIDISSSSANISINGGSIGNTNDPGGIGVDINGGTGNVTISATINDATAANAVVEVSGRTTGTVDFNGNITSTGGGISLTGNTGGTVRFDGGMNLSTGANSAFSSTASTGGTVVVTDTVSTSNILTTTTGTALNVANTTIGAEDLTFQSISANGATSGIILNTTGSSGGLTVTGTGTNGSGGTSGGTITNTTGVGVSLTNTRDVSLTNLAISNTGAEGIKTSSVTNFTYQDAAIVNAGDGNDENTIDLLNMFGTSLIEDVRLDDIQEDGIEIRQDADSDANLSTFDTITIRRLDLEDHQAGFGEAGIEIQTNLASTLAVVVDDSEFAINTNAIMGVAMSKSATFTGHQKVTIQDSTFDGSAAFGSGAIQALGSTGSGTTTYLITGNTITNTQFDGIRVNNDGGHTNVTITNNDIDGDTTPGKVNNGEGITLRQDENGSMTVLISGNDMTQITSNQIHINGQDATIDDSVINVDATITNNTGTVAGAFGAGILIDVGDGSGIAKNDVRVNISGNNLDGTETSPFFDFDITLQLNETSGASLRVTQASDAALTAANNGMSVSSFANPPNTITYNAGTPPLPPLPLLAAEGGVEAAQPADDAPPADETPPAGDTPLVDVTPPVDGEPPAQQPSDSTTTLAHSVIVDDGVLSQSELDYFVDAAIARWSEAGLTEAQLDALEAMSFGVADMSGLNLGSFSPTQIMLDADAAGRGWYLDGSPLDDSEFGTAFSATWLQTDPTGGPAGHYDLLTTVMHEMGHALGIGDSYSSGDRGELMYGWLYTGERRLPGDGDASGAVAGSIISEEFLGAPLDIGVLPFGKSVTIQWQATINAQTNQLIVNPSNQGTVAATNTVGFPDKLTDDPTVGGANDPNITTLDTLVLGNLVFNDVNKNGLFDAGDSAVNGVTLSLFVDANNDNVIDNEAAAPIATTTTAGGGLYSFAGLAPGNYIVRVDLANFQAGGALNTLNLQVSSTGNADPDDNVNNDDNGSRAPGAAAYSQTITLAYNTEPTAGTGNDTNNTLDFGFISNTPPVAANVGPFTGAEDQTSPVRVAITLSGTDADAGDAVERFNIASLAANGQLFDVATGGIALAVGAIISATLVGAAYQGTVYFQPNADFNGSTSFTYTAFDGDQNSAAATASITVNAANDPVTGAAPANASVNEDTPTAITGMSIADVDATLAPGGTYQVTLSSTIGTLTLGAGTLAALSFSTGDGTADATMTFTGTLANINTALATASYTSDPDFNGAATITLQVTDDVGGIVATGIGAGTSDSDVINVTVNATNDPVTGTAPANASANEDTPTAITGMSIADVDATLAPGGTYQVTLSSTIGTLTLGAGTLAALSFSTGDGTADATMTFTGTLANINTALATASYTSDPDFNGAATITLQVTDDVGGIVATGTGAGTSDSDVINVTVNAANDPVTGAAPANASVNEDTPTAITGMSIADVDATLAPGGTYQVTLSSTIGTLTLGAGTLAALSFSTGDGTADATMTFTGTLANINTALATASYTSDPDFNGAATITLQVTDDVGGIVATGIGAGTSDSDVINVTVNATNDPVTGTAPANASANEDTPTAITGMSIADVDATLAPGGTYQVTLSSTIGTLTLGAGTLAALSFSTGDGTADATMTFTGTLANINTALATASYTSDPDFNGAATITLQVTDDVGGIVATGTGAGTSDSDVINVTVNAANDPVTGAAPANASVNEDTPTAITGMSIADVDATLAPGGTYQVTLSSTIGTLTLGAGTLAALSFTTGDGTADATMTFTGTLANINTALATASYTSDPDFNGAATITLQVTDDVGGIVATGTGAGTSDSDVINVTVNAVADIVADTLTTTEDNVVIANVITGTNGASADNFEAAAVIQSVTQGTNGAVTSLANGEVTYTPNDDFNGSDTFQYTVLSGGVTETATVTVNIGAVNDDPVVASGIADQASPSNAEWTFQVPANAFDDVDGDVLTYAASLDSNPLPAWLTFNGVNRTFTGTPTLDLVGQLALKVTASDAASSVSDTFILDIVDTPSPVINLSESDDNFGGTGLGEVINGLGGNDTVQSGAGNDRVNGNNGNDNIDGGSGANVLHGNDGDDYVTSIGNLNTSFGDGSQDQLFFIGDQNQLFGSEGTDWLGVGGNGNALAGGAGDEWIGATGNGNTLNGQDGTDFLFAVGSGNAMHGETGNDWLGVSGDNNFLFGGAGNDWLGATGNGNTLDGGTGNDTLVAATGTHQGDVFNYRPGYAQDEIQGFALHNADGTDVISIQGFGVTTFGQLQTLMTQSGNDTVFTFNTADILTVRNVLPGQWQADDFQLA